MALAGGNYPRTDVTKIAHRGFTRGRENTVPLHSAAAAPGGVAHLIQVRCRHCDQTCVTCTRESRCLCGHRLKQHGRVRGPAPPTCGERGCRCEGFFFIYGQGSMLLRCRCKHKANEHDAASGRHPCARGSCSCAGFDSPWKVRGLQAPSAAAGVPRVPSSVPIGARPPAQCNCDCGWAEHEQIVLRVESSSDAGALEAPAPSSGRALPAPDK